MIPTTSKHVNIELLHPEFKRRLEAFFRDSRIRNKVKVVSGVRTYAQQKYFYDGYKSGKAGFNLAANPDRKTSSGFQGSYHMQQPAFDNWGYAVDFRITGRGISTSQVNAIAKSYGMVAYVRGEWWHHQPCKVVNGKVKWFDAPALKGTKATKTVKQDVKGIAAAFAEIEALVTAHPLKKGSKGAAVKVVQQLLAAKGLYRYKIDSDYGRLTRKAVVEFQKRRLLYVDGLVGPNTWKALLR